MIVTLPRGWTFDPGSNNEVVSRTYRIAGGSNAISAVLGTSRYQAIAQYVELDNGPRGGALRSGSNGALNMDLPVVVGDVDDDGLDDLVFMSDLSSGDLSDAQLRIMLSEDLIGGLRVLIDRPVAFTIKAFQTSNSILANPSVSVGDFDGDGKADLAFGADNMLDSAVWVHFDIAGGPVRRNDKTSFGDARRDLVRIVGPSGTQFGRMPSAAFDVTGDRIDDLLIGASGFDTDGGAINGGAVYVIAGAGRIIGTPNESLVLDLSNDSIRGIGDVTRDSQGDVNVQGVLEAQVSTDWYRFRTLGDGAIGDRIRISPTALADTEIRARDVAGQIGPGNRIFDDVPAMTLEAGRSTGVLEFDVEGLLQAYDDPTILSGASLRLEGSSGAVTVSSESLTVPDELTPFPGRNGAPDLVFFVASGVATGRELYVTDGTAEGTRLVYETVDGTEADFIEHLNVAGDFVYFVVSVPDDGESFSQQLYLTDGTKTFEVLNPDGVELRLNQEPFFVFNDDLYVLIGRNDSQLYKVEVDNDGTGTLVQVADLGNSNFDFTASFAAVNGGFYFERDEALWFTDGTNEGTRLIKKFDRLGTFATKLSATINNEAVFVADDGTGMKLWISDGVAGTEVLSSSIDGGGVENLLSVNGSLMFNIGTQLYTSDGTEDGTKPVRQLSDPAATGAGFVRSLEIDGKLVSLIQTFSKNLVISVSDPDGAEVSSALVTADDSLSVDGFSEWNNQLVLGYQVFNGPGQGFQHYIVLMDLLTGELQEIAEDIDDNFVGDFRDFVESGSLRIFTGPREDTALSNEIWVSNLTKTGTIPVANNGGGGGSVGGNVTLRFSGGRNDLQITGDERDETVVFTTSVALPASTGRVDINLTPFVDELRSLFAQGYRSIVAVMTINSGKATIVDPFEGNDTGLYLQQTGGAVGRLIGGDGRLIATDFTAYDLRNLPAGEYYIGVSRAAGQSIGFAVGLFGVDRSAGFGWSARDGVKRHFARRRWRRRRCRWSRQ